MASKTELLQRKAALEQAITNVLEGGQEFQTRNARVKQVPLETLQAQLANVEIALSACDGGNVNVVKLVYGGCR